MPDRRIAAGQEAYRRTYDTPLSALLSAIWGGSLHLGLFERPDEPLGDAQARAKRRMAEAARPAPGQRLVEVACGVGGTARWLAAEYGVRVLATNIAEAQLAEARALTLRSGLADRVTFAFADYHALPYEDAAFDGWWCQEALLYAADKPRVLREARRVAKRGARLVLSDLTLSRAMPAAARRRLAGAIKAPEIWAIEDWDRLAADLGLEVVARQDWSRHAAPTFERVAAALEELRARFLDRVGAEAVEGTAERVRLQLEAARAGRLGWCFYAIQA